MSRGDRSRTGRERTAAERERDRLERARRRASASNPPAPDASPSEAGAAPAFDAAPAFEDAPASEDALAFDGAPVPDGARAPGDAPASIELPPPAQPPPAASEPAPPASAERWPAEPAPLELDPAEPWPVEPASAQPSLPEPETEQLEPATAEPPLESPAAAQPPPHAQPPAAPEAPAPGPSLASGLPPLPPLPPPVRSSGTSDRARSRRRSWIARLSALLALAAVIVAVVALLHSNNSKSSAPPAAPPVVKVLIAEGKTRAQIAQIASADGLKGDYRAASKSSPLLNPASYGAPHGTPDLEGFLFPATYDMNSGAPVARLVQEQLVAFQENFGATEVARAHALHVTPYQLLIVASMVEREAQIPNDRPKIAAVIYNRLAAGMPLGIDASIYYAVELATGIATYTHELTEAQLHINSPYNTRTHTGLPPTPISNPGVASIEAAAHPAHVSYLYYVAGANGCGEQVFSNTLAEFEANVAAYKAAVARNGGHPPACKRTGK